MFFRLFNAPATFQEYVNKILAKKLDIFNIKYLDNILIFRRAIYKNYTMDFKLTPKILLFCQLKKILFLLK